MIVHHFADRIFQRIAIDIGDHAPPDSTVALYGCEHRRLASSATALADTFESWFSADVSFVTFHDPIEFRSSIVRSHRKANPVHEKQSRPITDLAVTFDL